MSRLKREYQMCGPHSAEDLGMYVTDLLTRGWVLYGPPLAGGDSRTSHSQALTRDTTVGADVGSIPQPATRKGYP
jgi:hypothetical protein